MARYCFSSEMYRSRLVWMKSMTLCMVLQHIARGSPRNRAAARGAMRRGE
jgi:hypothetical protein